MKAPQVIMIIWLTIAVVVSLFCHGKDKGKVNFFSTVFYVILEVMILKWGGFF